jgi:hypothetical protein
VHCHPDQDADAQCYCNSNEWAMFGFIGDLIQRGPVWDRSEDLIDGARLGSIPVG